MSARLPAALLALAILVAPVDVRAQFGARAEVARPIAAGSDVDPTASATTIELEGRPRALETTDEVLLEAPGARRRRSAGFGGFTSLSLRGAEAEHTTVLLGDVPLSTADGSAVDLSTLPPWLFERVEIYRGGAPVWLGAGAIGGVLRLAPRRGRGTRLEAVGGGGSYDLAQGRLGASVEGDGVSWAAVAGLTYSGGAYPITIESTPLVPGKGLEERVQTNAELLEAAGLAHARLRAGDATLSLVGLGLERTGGVPPPVTRWAADSDVRRRHTRALVALASEWLEDGRPPEQADLAAWRVQLAASIGVDRRGLSDRYAQYGLQPRESDQWVTRSSVRAAGTLRLAEWIDATAVLLGWHETFDPEDALAGITLGASRRDAGAAALEARLHGREGQARYELRPSVRVEIIDSALSEIRAGSESDRRGATDVLPTARLGGALEVVPGLAIAGSLATGVRAPSFVDLFGDGALVSGNTGLRPEESTGGDLGLVARGRVGSFDGFLEARGFALWIRDLIRYVRTDANQWTPQNVAEAWTAGLEASANVRFERLLRFAGALTWMESEDLSRGRALPFRPRLTVYGRIELTIPELPEPFSGVGAWIDAEYVGETFDTPENDVPIPEVTRIGAGASLTLWGDALRLDLIVRDLFDARGRDALLRPLPGRSVALQVAVRMD